MVKEVRQFALREHRPSSAELGDNRNLARRVPATYQFLTSHKLHPDSPLLDSRAEMRAEWGQITQHRLVFEFPGPPR